MGKSTPALMAIHTSRPDRYTEGPTAQSRWAMGTATGRGPTERALTRYRCRQHSRRETRTSQGWMWPRTRSQQSRTRLSRNRRGMRLISPKKTLDISFARRMDIWPKTRKQIDSEKPLTVRLTNVSTDSNGVATYRQALSEGTQAWAEVCDGQITNGGVNDVPR